MAGPDTSPGQAPVSRSGQEPSGRGRPSQLRQPRVADLVASMIRSDILSGQLRDGDLLPKQETLVARYGVSVVPIREALRILESEGLIRTQRGVVGGAVVHAPTAAGVAYMSAMALEYGSASIAELCTAVQEVEPLCAAMCARREDRMATVLPQLRSTIDGQRASLDDGVEFTRVTNQFHLYIVGTCGNPVLGLLGGALEALWVGHNDEQAGKVTQVDVPVLQKRIREHEKVIMYIERGNPQGAAKSLRDHLEDSHELVLRTTPRTQVSAALMREALDRMGEILRA